MGTNYYARIIPKEEDKNDLINAIINDDFNKILELSQELYGSKDEYSGLGGEIHLGKNSAGWSFLWNPNVRYYCDGYLDENKQFVPVWKYEFTYPLNKQGITDFINREDIYIIDEYGEIQNKSEFLEWAFNKQGLSHKEYQENPKYDSGSYWGEDPKVTEKWINLGFFPEYGEFFADGLRFSTCQEFC